MTKKIINDMLPSKRSIRQIPLSKDKKADYQDLKKEIVDLEENKGNFKPRRVNKIAGGNRKPLNPKFVIWLIAIICLLALFFGVSILFSSATVIVTPRTEKITFNNDAYSAKLESAAATDLTFEVLKVKEDLGETVEATAEKQVSQKASGKIVIYNNYSTSPQRLINNTRFEAANGKVYRISTSVIIPGQNKESGKIIPGSVEATVVADQAGEDYNLKVSDLKGDFKIPGFKGDLRYVGFYALLKEDIVGGFIGKQRIVADDLRKSTEDALKGKLKDQLLKELYAIKPENYFLFKDGYSLDFSDLPDTAVETNKVQINIEGILNGVVFNNSKLAKYLATQKIANFDGLPVTFIPADNLIATLKGTSPVLWKNDALDIKITGDADIKWQYDSTALKRDLLGRKETDLKSLSAKYKDSILGLKVLFRPVWTRYFPDNINKIKVEENI